MFSGIQEILLLLLVVAAVVLLPRLVGRRQTPTISGRLVRHHPAKLSGAMRAAILGSVLWLCLTAVYFEPWQRGFSSYLLAGAGPVALFWGILWTVAGFRHRR
jgi:hypothetical protein